MVLSPLSRRLAILLGATALTGASLFPPAKAMAQQIINHNGGKGDNGASVFGFAIHGDTGKAPAGPVNFINTNTISSISQPAFAGYARGGDGGDGGTVFAIVALLGGDGGDGHVGGTVDITNTARLDTAGNFQYIPRVNVEGMVADATGGSGGVGGFAASLVLGFSGGDGGRGGMGGTAIARATSTSSILTRGVGANGISAVADGGHGGKGGFDGVIGLNARGGMGGNGGGGGTAMVENAGSIETHGNFAKGILVRAAGGIGGDGMGAFGAIASGGNGGGATAGGSATGVNSASGRIVTRGDYASAMVVQSIGGGGGDGDGALGFFGGGGTGAIGNHGGSATATNDGVIITSGLAAIGMLAESVGGGGGDGGGAAGIVSIGGSGDGGGDGGTVVANIGGAITTGGDGSHGVLAQSVGGGGNGGFALSAGPVAAVSIGGGGGTGGHGGVVNINQSGASATVATNGRSAIGILAQSIGGGGGNGGGTFALGGVASVSIGGAGDAAGDGQEVNYGIANATVNTRGADSIGILIQSVGGGGGNGGFALGAAAAAAVGVGGEGAAAGIGRKVDVTTGGRVETMQARSAGIVAQSIGGGGGNGGFVVEGSLGATVGVGGKGGGGGSGGDVFFRTAAGGQSIVTHGVDSTGLIVQSVGGGGGNGGFVLGLSPGVSVGVGGSGAGGGDGGKVVYNSTAMTVTTHGQESAGVIVQSVGGGGGNGGFALNGAVAATIGVGGIGGAAGNAETIRVALGGGDIDTTGDRSSGLIAQSIGGGGGTGGAVAGLNLGLGVSIGGKGGGGGNGDTVDVVTGVDIHTKGVQSHGVLAQSLGGGGGSGGFSLNRGGPSFSLGGNGGAAGYSRKVFVSNSGQIRTEKDLSIGILAQSVGGSGGDGGMSGTGSAFATVAVGGEGGAGGSGGVVEVVNNAGITTRGWLAHGILAQSIGGGGGNGGSASAVAQGVWGSAGVALGGGGGAANFGSQVTVTHKGDIHVSGFEAKAILAQSVGGSGGNGGNAYSAAESAGLYASAAVGVSVGGEGGDGGNGGRVTVRADGNLVADSDAAGSGGIVAQSVGGGGGNAGRATSAARATSDDVSIGLGVSIGGWGGDGGKSDLVIVNTGLNGGGLIQTSGANAAGILAQSVAGSGGSGGDSWSSAEGYGATAAVNATVSIGGGGGDGNVSGDVLVNNAMMIITGGDVSAAISAQSIGGGGGKGNVSGAVAVTNSGILITEGDYSAGILAQSLGGGGGMGGAANAKAFHAGGSAGVGVTANVSIGGNGGEANDAAMFRRDAMNNIVGAGVAVDNSGMIQTRGFSSVGILAMSVGGGGGAGGAASTDEEVVGAGVSSQTTVGIGAAIALGAGGGGDGGTVSVTNRGLIVTAGADSHGVSANSIGGGVGVGGSSSSGTFGTYAIGGSLGGAGGKGGSGAQVDVFNLSSAGIWTQGERSIAILAQSVGGGGGAGGAGASKGRSDGGEVSVNLSLGGSGEVGGDGGKVNVRNAGWIVTEKANSHGILAQSVGGSGGVGGASGTSANDSRIAITFSLGGAGGDGGLSDKVHVTNSAGGSIATLGDNSHGIFAQSVGGGGGAGSTETGKAETAVSLFIGGQGGLGSKGGDVQIDNFGRIETVGYLSHGIFAQSVGGGGGASGAATGASKAQMTIGGGASGLPIVADPDQRSDGGYVEVNNDGEIITHRDGSYGVFAQSIGGGGGYGGTVTSDAAGGNSVSLSLGGKGGNGGNGGDVKVTVSGSIVTHGERAHGVVAQSVGGGGGVGGDAKGQTSNALGIGGLGGNGGDGGDVTVIRTGAITTTGKDSMAIVAQSVGGGGGLGGAGFGRFGATADGGSGIDNNTIGFNSFAGAKGSGGVVTIVQDGDIRTDGDRAHGIFAQAVGGGGGIGDAAAASASSVSQVWINGASAYAMFGQSATGQGNSSAVDLTTGGSLFAQGLDSVAAYGQSTSDRGFRKGDITIDLNGRYTIGGGGAGVAIALVGGRNNIVTNNSLTYALGGDATFIMDAADLADFQAALAAGPVAPEKALLASLLDQFSPLAITGTSGNDRIDNRRSAGTLGRVVGNVDLGGGSNSFNNSAGSSMVALQTLDLGGGLFSNAGRMWNKGIGVLATVDVTGSYTQAAGGQLVTDLDLDTHMTDVLTLSGAGDFNGEAPLNFLSIDRLFGEYVLSTGATMATTMTPTTLAPTVGFNFLTRVDKATDLVLYAQKPTFEDLINDPLSGVKDPGVVQMAQYLDGLETLPTLYDNPSELARMLNMLRFLPDEAELGKALTRLTPHYAVHTFEMLNRSTDIVLQTARECADLPATYDYDGRCIWLTVTPHAQYERDAGPGTTSRADTYKTLSLGAMGEVGGNWSLGATLGRTEFESDIRFGQDLLSSTTGAAWQAYALARYEQQGYFADFALGGGAGNFDGERDTTLAQVGFIPGETLAGEYLDQLLLDGIGNSVSFHQDTRQFGASARLGMTHHLGGIYLQPSLQLDARWLHVSGHETGSVAAFDFSGSSNTYLSATPGLEVGADIALGDSASLRAYVKGGVEFSSMDWKISGQFAAAEGLGAPPLSLTQSADSPLYRVGAGMELNGANGVGLSVRYNGVFGDKVKMNTVSAAFKVRF
jgi:hypothetical protein